MIKFNYQVLGNAKDIRTECEISIQENDSEEKYIGFIYEEVNGWKINMNTEKNLKNIPNEDISKAIEEAKSKLMNYKNRTGINYPNGLTRAGLSLWLMTKNDGTAMGMKIE